MYVHNLPMHLVRALAPPRFAAGVLVTLALLSAAYNNDPASRINSAPLLSSSINGPSAAASSAPSLGAAANFVVLGGTSVTCTGSAVTGNVGVSPDISVTGFPPTSTLCTLAGTIHAGDATAASATRDFLIAYDALKAMTCDPANNLTGQDLGGKSLAPGVYCFNTTAGLTGVLTLKGPSNGIWVFQIGTGLTTGSGSTGPASVVMAGGGQACNVFWQVGSLATIGTNTAFQGNILAGTAITFTGTGSSLVGRALAKAEVTMTGTTITGCNGNKGKHKGQG
jgi:Ice-binding-like